MKRPILLLSLLLFINICNAQLISTNQYFKEDFEISKYRNDNCIANMLNTIALDAGENIGNIKFSIFYEVEISDSLYFSFKTTEGNILYSKHDISNFLLPEKVQIKCGSFNRTIDITGNKTKYSFARPTNPNIAECSFIFGNDALNKFNNKVGIIHTCTALSIVSDTLINMLNGFTLEEKYIGTDIGIFLTFIDSQIDYIKKSSDSIAKISTPADVAALNNKIKIVEGRRNSVALSYSGTYTNRIAITDGYALDLASRFCNYNEKWLYMTNLSKHLYSGEIAFMSNFKRTKPKLEGFLNTISEQAKNVFLNYMHPRLLNDAKKAFKDNNVNIALILIDNYEYISGIAPNQYADEFHNLKVECLETLRDSYTKLAERFEKNDNYSTSKNYRNQADAIQKDLLALEDKAQYYSEFIAENKETTTLNPTPISTKEPNSTTEPNSTEEEIIIDTTNNEIEKKDIAIVETKEEIAEIVKEEAIIDNCSDYKKKLKVLADKIDSYTMFTIENLYNRYTNEHPECAELSLNEWIKSIGREELLPKKRKK